MDQSFFNKNVYLIIRTLPNENTNNWTGHIIMNLTVDAIKKDVRSLKWNNLTEKKPNFFQLNKTDS